MRSRRFRPGLLLIALAGLVSCEINPQPPLPSRPATPTVGGSLNLGESMAGSQSGLNAGGIPSDIANGGSLGVGEAGQAPSGAGGADAETDAGGAGGATDAGAGGIADAVVK